MSYVLVYVVHVYMYYVLLVPTLYGKIYTFIFIIYIIMYGHYTIRHYRSTSMIMMYVRFVHVCMYVCMVNRMYAHIFIYAHKCE